MEMISVRFSRVRLAIFLVGAASTFFAFRSGGALYGWATGLVFVAIFSAAAYMHNRVIAAIRRHRIYQQIKQSHIARIDREWDSLPPTHLDIASSDHAFARDLNLTGDRSLHHLLDSSFTLEGSRRLQNWLLNWDGNLHESSMRQSLVQELVPMTAFRDRLSLLSALVTRDTDDKWEGDVILRWLERHTESPALKYVLLGLSALATTTLFLFTLSLFGLVGNLWVLSLTLYAGIYLYNFRLYGHLFDEAEHLYFQLNRFRPVLQFLERWRYVRDSRLETHCSPFVESDDSASSKTPSAYLKTIMWLSVAASAQKNEVLRLVLNLVLPWDLLFTFILSRYKARLSERLPLWLDRISTLEAANSLALFGALHPNYSFPSLSAEHASVFEAEGLGHPLISDSVKIRNDFMLDSASQLVLVTGSNMSGKSTFLRTVGTNLALAFAGGPVDASVLNVKPMRLFTCMNVSDSVTDGISYFYAEVKRLKLLLQELEKESEIPLMYLVDEIFRGTNNRERLTGSRSLLLRFIEGNGMGIVSTHDLELIHLEDESDLISNFHFREHVSEGKMVFDYRLRTGPCPTTNALKIMEMEGLPVSAAAK